MQTIPTVDVTELEKGDAKVVIMVFKDGYVGVCADIEGDSSNCYVTHEPDPNVAFMARAWYESLGFEVKKKLRLESSEFEGLTPPPTDSNNKNLPPEFLEIKDKYGELYAYAAYKYLTRFKRAMEV